MPEILDESGFGSGAGVEPPAEEKYKDKPLGDFITEQFHPTEQCEQLDKARFQASEEWYLTHSESEQPTPALEGTVLSEHPWRWQGDDEDHLESLSCPVLIEAEDLRNLIASERLAQVAATRKEITGWLDTKAASAYTEQRYSEGSRLYELSAELRKAATND